MVGREIGGRYRLEAEIGRGGLGVVYRALDRKLDRRVALKLLRREVVEPSQRSRFEREARALAALGHPNVVAILDCGVSESSPYLVMELLEGQSLADALKQKLLPLARTESIVRELIAALAYVHAKGLVHRDLKPGNVFLQRLPGGGEQVKLLDFGLAKFLERAEGGESTTLTRTGEVFGTPAYMPPEQWSGQAVDARADVYAASVVCFELLAGRKPFVTEGQELLLLQLTQPPPLLHEACAERVGCPDLERLLQRALSSRPQDRPCDGGELAAALSALPQPWLFEGADATEARRRAASTVREALSLGTAKTVEQPAHVPDPAPIAHAPAPASAPRPRPGVMGSLLRRLVLAGAFTLSFASLAAIAVASAVIYVMRSPSRVEERAALQRALPPLKDAVARGAAAAKAVVDRALPPGSEGHAAALPSQPPPSPESASPPTTDASVTPAARERARDPWRGPTPSELRKLRVKADAGQRGTDAMLRELRGYNREHLDDARGHLVLARLFVNRSAWNEVITQYQLAFARDPSSRGDPHMRQDLLRAACREPSFARASEAVRAIYGSEALDAIAEARAHAPSPAARARLDRLARALSP